MALPKKQFQGTLDGETVRSLTKKFDFGIMDLEGRVNKVKEILNCSDFFVEYLSKYYSGIANTKTPLSEDNNVFQLIEKMVTYIMNSTEIKEEFSKNEIKYIFYKDRDYFEKMLAREVKFDGVLDPNNESGEIFLHYFMSADDKNYKEALHMEIEARDLIQEGEMGEVLREYQSFLNDINIMLSSKTPPCPRYYLTRTKRSLQNDMIDVKTSYKGIFKGKKVGVDSCDYNLLGLVDLTDPWHVQQTLKFPVGDLRPESEMDILLHDLQKAVDNTKLSDTWKDILEYYRQGMTTYEIAENVGIGQPSVAKAIQNISRRVANTMKKMGGYKDV